jgi:hypothetical protein
MQEGAFRRKLSGLVSLAALLSAIIGCKSNAGSAINDEGAPTTDTGYISAATTGGDAAGTANMTLEEGEGHGSDEKGAEHLQGGRASKTPEQQGGNAGR